MKRVFFSFLSALMLFAVQQVDAVKYVDAQSLTFLGKMCETTNPYHRVEVDDYPSLNNTEKTLLRDASGLAVVFETNSSSVWVKAQVGVHRTSTGMPRAAAEGFNMYINVDGEWIWAASRANAKVSSSLLWSWGIMRSNSEKSARRKHLARWPP